MNRFWGSLLVVAGITFAFCTHAVASSQKVGFLDVAKVISQSHWGKQISNNLKGDQVQLTNAVQQQKEQFTSARDSYMKKRDIMDAKARARKEQQLEQMAAKLQKLLSDSQAKWTEEKKQAMEPLFKKMYEVANKVAKSENYDLVVDRSALIVADPKNDISSKVISELDRSH
ncbi:MAG: OmpH family outer membrane protein [Syntrophobacteraceae bacterium]|nr:OmpH family outer membrane protein [Syntrophobacteraceae bacterium]